MMLAKMPSAKTRLRNSGGGVFEITVDDKLERRPADFRQTKKCSARSPREPTRPLVHNGERVACRLAAAIYHRPRIRLTIRQRSLVLEQWPQWLVAMEVGAFYGPESRLNFARAGCSRLGYSLPSRDLA